MWVFVCLLMPSASNTGEDGFTIDCHKGLDLVVDGGLRVADPSTVVDMTVFPPKIIRQGKGLQLHWMVAEDDSEPAESMESSSLQSLET